MKSRLTQLVARALAAGMVAVFTKLGIDHEPGSVLDYALLIATGLVGAGSIAVDFWLHRVLAAKK